MTEEGISLNVLSFLVVTFLKGNEKIYDIVDRILCWRVVCVRIPSLKEMTYFRCRY